MLNFKESLKKKFIFIQRNDKCMFYHDILGKMMATFTLN